MTATLVPPPASSERVALSSYRASMAFSVSPKDGFVDHQHIRRRLTARRLNHLGRYFFSVAPIQALLDDLSMVDLNGRKWYGDIELVVLAILI
jgi:hypothetical protein